MDYYYIWKYTVKTNLQEYIVSLQEDPTCSCILGVFVCVPFMLYVLLGCLYTIFVVIPIQIYSCVYDDRKNEIVEVAEVVDIVVERQDC